MSALFYLLFLFDFSALCQVFVNGVPYFRCRAGCGRRLGGWNYACGGWQVPVGLFYGLIRPYPSYGVERDHACRSEGSKGTGGVTYRWPRSI